MGKDANQKQEEEQEALRLKSLAEAEFANSDLKSALNHAKKAHRLCPSLDGLSSMLTAFRILRVASAAGPDDNTTDWYQVLQVEPFSHINTIKQKYKKLALELHPDKNSHVCCAEAFKLVGEGFRVLSDKIRRKEYDMRLRIRLQDEKVSESSAAAVETFWTACSRCRLLHQFERKYLGHNLVCPSCKKSFKAVEVEGDGQKDGHGVRVRSERLRRKMAGGEELGAFGGRVSDGAEGIEGSRSGRKTTTFGVKGRVSGVEVEGNSSEGMASVNLKRSDGHDVHWGGGRLRTGGLRRRVSTVLEVLERSVPKKVKFADEMMTLAEMQLEAKQKAAQNKVKLKEKQKDLVEEKNDNEEDERESFAVSNTSKHLGSAKVVASRRSRDMEINRTWALKKSDNKETPRPDTSRKSTKSENERRVLRKQKLEIMAVEDLDFYDFDKDRVGRNFKKGQVWAIYDDDDRLPRRYGLIDEVISVNPFEVNLRWFDLQSHGDERLISWKKRGLHLSCGRYEVAEEMIVDSVNVFSHVVECERAAKETYRIYPRKGSIWALHNEANAGVNGSQSTTDECLYNIVEAEVGVVNGRHITSDKCGYRVVVFLTTYSEIHGLSMAYLEKVDGYKTLFKRQEVGYHAVRYLRKDDIHLLSHQIPARKVSADEIPETLKDCWKLDPASLPPE